MPWITGHVGIALRMKVKLYQQIRIPEHILQSVYSSSLCCPCASEISTIAHTLFTFVHNGILSVRITVRIGRQQSLSLPLSLSLLFMSVLSPFCLSWGQF